MKKTLILFVLSLMLGASACAAIRTPTPEQPPEANVSPIPTNPPSAEPPTPQPQPTPEPNLGTSNLYAYNRDSRVYIFNPADLSVFHVGDSAHAYGYSADCGQNSPRLSLDGRYIAFEAQCANAFIVYDLVGHNTLEVIEKESSPEILGDTLLGWGENGRLYYTRMVGGCSFTPELKGPDRMEVYSYDPSLGGTRYEFDLPKVSDAPHAYSIGITIDPQAEHVIAWNAACSVGLGSRFVFDTTANSYEIDPPFWPASFGDLSGHFSDLSADQYVIGADGGKLYVLSNPQLEWDPNARLMFLAPEAADPVQIDSGYFIELVSQAPLIK